MKLTTKNQTLTGKVERLGTNGEGVCKVDGVTYFVPFALVGEEITFLVLKQKDTIGYGKLLEVNVPSPKRTIPQCPVFGRCGGCQLQHLVYPNQLSFKKQLVEDALRKIGGVDCVVEETIASGHTYAYRNKLQLPIGVDKEGNTVVGFYAERSHRIVPIENCLIHPNWAKEVIDCVLTYSKIAGVKGYDERTKQGSLRHIVVRELNGKFIVTIVSAKKDLPQKEIFIEQLSKIFERFTLWLNHNDQDTNVVWGKEFTLLYGEGTFEAEEKGILFEAGPQTFVQVNASVRGKLYDAVLETVTGAGDEVVVDAYSGAGLLTAMIAKRAKRVYGIEIVPEAVACANAMQKKNGLSNMTNVCGAVEDKLQEVLEKEKGEKIRLVLDPPRAGVHRSVFSALMQSNIPQITMVSCDPATLARDLGILTGNLVEKDGALVKGDGKGKYEVTLVQPYDMFPQTKHVETVVCLSHKKPDGHISVNVEFGEEEGQVSLKDIEKRAPKKKTTYKDIQAYIEEKYGFKVHTAYIAEVKRDLGLPMYDAPNAVEELKRPRSHPTAKMIEAIKDALKHFEMI